MSFKTMDGVEVYDKRDIDLIKDSIDTTTSQHSTDINQLKNKTNSLENSKANATQVQELANELTVTKQSLTSAESNISEHSNRLTELESRVTATENDKLNASDLPQAVSDAVDVIINSKLALIESDINHIVDNAIDNELEDYDNKATVDQKITTAIDNELEDYDNKATVDQKITTAVTTAIATAVATRPTAMSTAEATAIVDRYF